MIIKRASHPAQNVFTTEKWPTFGDSSAFFKKTFGDSSCISVKTFWDSSVF